MAIETAFRGLHESSHGLRNSIDALRTAIDDRPPKGDVVLVDDLIDRTEDMLGLAEEVIAAAAEGAKAVAYPQQLDPARFAMARCHPTFNRLARIFFSELSSFERIEDLLSLGRGKGGEWRSWSREVKGAIERLSHSIHSTGDALFECWRELADRLASSSVSVQTTNIGQQIEVRDQDSVASRGFT